MGRGGGVNKAIETGQDKLGSVGGDGAKKGTPKAKDLRGKSKDKIPKKFKNSGSPSKGTKRTTPKSPKGMARVGESRIKKADSKKSLTTERIMLMDAFILSRV